MDYNKNHLFVFTLVIDDKVAADPEQNGNTGDNNTKEMKPHNRHDQACNAHGLIKTQTPTT